MTLFETARFTVRDLTPDDAEDFFAIFGDAEVMRFLGSGDLDPYPDIEYAGRALRAIERRRTDDPQPLRMYACEERETGRMPATVGLTVVPGDTEIEVYYQVARSAWGRGIATEVARGMSEHAMSALGLDRVVAYVFPENPASRRVVEKLGMRYEGRRPYEGNDLDYFVLDG